MARSGPKFYKKYFNYTIYLHVFGEFDVILGTNGGGMDRYGLILNQNGDLSFKKVFKYPPGLKNSILEYKITNITKLPKSYYTPLRSGGWFCFVGAD